VVSTSRRFVLFAFACAVAPTILFAGCGGDDAASAVDSGAEDATRDAHVTPFDAGTQDTGPNDDASTECLYCSQIFPNGLNPSNPPPCAGTTALYVNVINCVCNEDLVTEEAGAGSCDIDSGTGDSGTGACADFCPYTNRGLTLSNECLQCAAKNCPAPVEACAMDGADAG
jgi:hypothetical protein